MFGFKFKFLDQNVSFYFNSFKSILSLILLPVQGTFFEISFMSKRLRLIVNILAWLAFLFVAPFLVSYSMGHRFFSSPANPVTVGTFLVRTIPNNAVVSLDGKRMSNHTPMSIKNLLPDSYNLSIVKDNYRVWSKNLPITGTRITDIRDVRLLPEKIEESVMRENVTDFSVSPKQQLLAVFENLPAGRQIRLVPFNDPAATGTPIKLVIGKRETAVVLWSPDESSIILKLTANSNVRNYLINSSSGVVTELPASAGDVVGWLSTMTENKLLVIKNKKVSILTRAGVLDHVLTQTAEKVALGNNGVAIQEGGAGVNHIEIYSSGANLQESLNIPDLSNDAVGNIILSSSGDLALISQPAQKLFIWDHNGRQWHKISDHAENVKWSFEGDKIFWQESEFDIWVMNLHEERTPLSAYAPELVVRLSVPIRNPAWFIGSHHILFFDKDIIKLIELDPRDGYHIESLMSTNRGDGNFETIKNGNEIMATVKRDNLYMLSRFFLLDKTDR